MPNHALAKTLTNREVLLEVVDFKKNVIVHSMFHLARGALHDRIGIDGIAQTIDWFRSNEGVAHHYRAEPAGAT